jgi:glyoxylase-like metal-dependent hydrolase (beta-lactamase superfamily II)/ferredoxin
MARVDLRHPLNAEGDWFVDTRCIDCGTCRDIAPGVFGDAGGYSVVTAQPASGDEQTPWLAAQACPTTSIGTRSRRPRPGRLYPREVEPTSGVWDLGYCSEDSFGASAWLVTRPAGNVLIDSPRYTEALVGPVEALGGIERVVLTHRDDVADAARWAERFGARTWIHADDRSVAPWADELFRGTDDVEVQAGLVAVPTPGHTKGSVVYLLDDRYLFTGDSLAWSHVAQDLVAFRQACWWSWSAQADSLERLAAHRFSWVLPGHGARINALPEDLHLRLLDLVERMRRPRASAGRADPAPPVPRR